MLNSKSMPNYYKNNITINRDKFPSNTGMKNINNFFQNKLMNSFNKTEAAISLYKLCFLLELFLFKVN